MKIGIFQPGRIGDIIICLPIAKYYADKGFKVVWPLLEKYAPSKNFKEYVNYVEFTTFKNYEDFLDLECNFIIDLCFNVFNGEPFQKYYLNQLKYSFDQVKYQIANVPFSFKWCLDIKRNYNKEKELYDKLVKNEDYIVVQHKASNRKMSRPQEEKAVEIMNRNKSLQIIEIQPLTDSVFDWLTILEKAKKVILIESCMTNLIDQLDFKIEEKYCVLKEGYYGKTLESGRMQGMPVLKSNWIYI